MGERMCTDNKWQPDKEAENERVTGVSDAITFCFIQLSFISCIKFNLASKTDLTSGMPD